jgi:hypothetical protein
MKSLLALQLARADASRKLRQNPALYCHNFAIFKERLINAFGGVEMVA